jgi:hypothetical protein
MTHRLRWAGSSNPSQVTFESFAEDGAALYSYTGQSELLEWLAWILLLACWITQALSCRLVLQG